MTVAPYLAPADLRGRVPALSNARDDVLVDLVAEFEEFAEGRLRGAYRRRTVVGEVQPLGPSESRGPWGNGYREVGLDWPWVASIEQVVSSVVGVAGTTVVDSTAYELTDAKAGLLAVNVAQRYGKVAVDYTHGVTAPTQDLLRACRLWVRSMYLSDASGVPRDVVAQSTDGAYSRFSMPDIDKGLVTGLIEVDAILRRIRRPRGPMVG